MNHSWGLGETGQQSRALAFLVEDLGLVPDIHMCLTAIWNSNPRRPDAVSSGLHRYHVCAWHTHASTAFIHIK